MKIKLFLKQLFCKHDYYIFIQPTSLISNGIRCLNCNKIKINKKRI